jgi:N6-adenosine-specific RNA methylase IME4
MKEYQIIYADPPWTHTVWSMKGNKRSACQHYSTMSKEELQTLPIQKISAKNSVLLMWVTAPCLEEGLELIGKWGFIYKTIGFTWIKKNKRSDSLFWGMGYYTRANTELCLLATKGKPLRRVSRSVHQVVVSPVREHSRKPDEVRERIIGLLGNLPRIELFARQKPEGWDTFGGMKCKAIYYSVNAFDPRRDCNLDQ